MVLELEVPQDTTWAALRELRPVLLSYELSFIYLGIYWNNHHHMLQLVDHVDGATLWANMHLLFWLSLVPFTTAWMGENDFAATPAAAYGITLLGAALAYYALQTAIIRDEGRESLLAAAIGRDLKGKASPLLYSTAIALSFVARWLSIAIYVLVALIWLVPDRRVERMIALASVDAAER
jgi:uncharacterized membrane protein